MPHSLFQISLLVDDYDKAIEYYTRVLGFQLKEDTTLSPEKRWVVVSPAGANSCSLLLAKASTDEQRKYIGNQTGGRVFLFLHTQDIDADFAHLKENSVRIVRGISKEEYGRVLVFADLYGNLWDLIEPSKK